MGRLEYDDSAFAYFGLTFVILISLPYTYYYYNTVFGAQNAKITGIDQIPASSLRQLLKTNKKIKPRSPTEERKLRTVLSSGSPFENIFSKFSFSTVIKTVILLFLWINLYHFSNLCYNEETQLSQFDPYEILDVSRDSTEKQIRKKYRKLSIQWHPDQWATKSIEEKDKAEATFIKISNVKPSNQ